MAVQSNNTSQTEASTNQQQAAKKNSGCGIFVAIVVFLIMFGIGKGCAQGLRDSSSDDKASEKPSLSQSTKESTATETVSCYSIFPYYIYRSGSPIISKYLSSATHFICRINCSSAETESECVYMSISIEDFERFFGPTAYGATGVAHGEYTGNADTFTFYRAYTVPLVITVKRIDNPVPNMDNVPDEIMSFVSLDSRP